MNSKNNPRTKRSLLLTLLVSLLLIAGINPPPSNLSANSASLSAQQDSYTDLNFPTTNFDGGLLNAANSMGPPGDPDVSTKYVYLEFDLSNVDFTINSAILSLGTLTCGGLVAVDEVDIAVYGVDNSTAWSEVTLTWDTQPTPSTNALITLDGGTITAGTSQWYTWTDGYQGALSAWLETQRTANDGSATLTLAIENSGDPGLADVFFEDSEGTGAAYGCGDAPGAPTLKVSESVTGYEIFLPLVVRDK